MKAKQWGVVIISLIFLVSIYLVNGQDDRNNFTYISAFYSVAFVSYLALYYFKDLFSFKHMLIIGIAAHAISMIHLPYLSNDYFRFLWDGEITWLGYNPFDYKPN